MENYPRGCTASDSCTRLCTHCLRQPEPEPIYFQVFLFQERIWCDTEIV